MSPSYFINAFTPASVIQSRLRRKIIMQFAEKTGLVYFGHVDQNDDEHALVRGATMSLHHKDKNYCIGSYQGHDITLVERIDTIKTHKSKTKKHTWLIMAFDLKQSVDIPHIFLGLNTHSKEFYQRLFISSSYLSPVYLGNLGIYGGSFSQKYTIYASPSQALSTERLISPEIAKTITEHFGSLTFEINDGVLYVYSEHQRLTQALLDHMLKSGLWLAERLSK